MSMDEDRQRRLKAMRQVGKEISGSLVAELPFQHRGFSGRTITALVDCTIDAPERLLFMTEEQLRSIPGVSKASMAEIRAYREKFVR